ncbi:MAG TPA: PAAR domain-containing protein [Paraburkholderia sp.]|uniref:PAAR domain-containing protein n=1 Tax=Paraburkholderia sp. TaxID=1926495 RepID=UPI002DE238B5|nr:PAAR domain-containing protein [Paraburkholderia sp.]
MRRAILKLGDKSTNGGVVTEGIDSCTHHGTPITFIGARVWCNGCKSEGVIGWKGPHRTATMMGKQQALDGDICICKCTPPPVMLASQDSAWHSFTHEEWAAMGAGASGTSMTSEYRGAYDEQYTLTDNEGYPISGRRYRVRIDSNIVANGVTDANGKTQRIATDTSKRIRLEVVH